MEKESNHLSPQDSIELIERVLNQTRERYEENGNNITLWGLAVVIAGIAGFALAKFGHAEKSGIPWLFTIIPLFLYTFITEGMKGRNIKKEKASFHITDYGWLMSGIFALITGFLLRPSLGESFLLVLFLPFCVAALLTALHLKNRVFVALTILSSFIAFSTVFISIEYHTLLSSLLALLMFLIPGLMLRADYKSRR